MVMDTNDTSRSGEYVLYRYTGSLLEIYDTGALTVSYENDFWRILLILGS